MKQDGGGGAQGDVIDMEVNWESGRPWHGPLERRRQSHAFLSASWFDVWEDVFLGTGSWHAPASRLVVMRNGERVGVMPLAWQRVRGVWLLAVTGFYMPFRDVIVAELVADAAIKAMVSALSCQSTGIGVRIGPMDSSSGNLARFREQFRQQAWSLLEFERGQLFYLELPETKGELERKVSGRAKKADYFLRRMSRRGRVELRMHTDLDQEGWGIVLQELQEIEKSSWVATGGEPRFIGDRNLEFWSRLLGRQPYASAVRVWLLHFEGQPSSFCLTLDSGKVRYQLVNGYSDAVRSFSTGHIIFQKMLLDAIDCGIKSVNFGQGDPGHKSEWGARPTARLVDLVALKPGLVGGVGSAVFRFAQWVQQRRRGGD